MSRRTLHRPAFSIHSRASIPKAVDLINRAFAGRYRLLLQEPSTRREVTLYDTFDWRLYKSHLVLMTTASSAELISAHDGSVVESGDPLAGDIVKVESLASVTMRDRLYAVTDPRSLLKICAVTLEQRTFRTVDDIEKTMGSGVWMRAARPLSHAVTIIPMRGFEEDIGRLVHEAVGMLAGEPYHGFVMNLLATGGRKPGDYPSKVALTMDPDESIERALSRVILYFSGILSENLPGIFNDWDSEFLHDYRVVIRRMRCMVSEARRILKQNDLKQLVETLKDLSRGTGDVRDLDVLLSREAQYRSSLPAALHPGLEDFFRWTKQQRQTAIDDLLRRMSGNNTARLLSTLNTVAQQLDNAEGKSAVSARTCAAKWIRRRLRRVLDGLDVFAGLDEERLHKLRINCKKLRYLLEVFGSMFEAGVVEELTGQTKKFQDSLGQLNDLTVQQRVLTQTLERMQGEVGNAVQAAASIGGLIAETSRRRPALLDAVADAQKRFRSLARNHVTRKAFAAQTGGDQ